MDKLQQVYDLYLSQGLLSDNISFEQFSAADEEQQNKLYTLGKENGLFSSTGADTFKSAWGSQSFQTDPVKETADAGSENQAVSTELPLADTLSVSEKKKLSYKERQDLVHSRGRFAVDQQTKLENTKNRLIQGRKLSQEEISSINETVDNIDFTETSFSLENFLGDFSLLPTSTTGDIAPTIVGKYEGQLKEAEENLKKLNKDYTQEDIHKEAKKIIKQQIITKTIDDRTEEILEEVKGDYTSIGGAIMDLLGVDTVLSGAPGLGIQKPTEYDAIRALLINQVEEEEDKTADEYQKALAKIELDNNSAKQAIVALNSYEEKISSGKNLTEAEQQDYNYNVDLLQVYEKNADQQLQKLVGLQEELQDFASLADLTKRSYSVVDKIQGRASSRVLGFLGGLTKNVEKLTSTALLERAGIDINNPDDLKIFPEPLRNLMVNEYTKKAEKNLGRLSEFLYSESEKITGGIEKRQNYGDISSVEDFFEFTTDLMSEQAVNTAITAGIPTIGLALVSAASAGDKLRELDIEEEATGKKVSFLEYYGSGLSAFGAEYLTEKVALDNFNKLAKYNYKKAFNINGPDYTLDINKMTAKTALGKWAKSAASEGGAEFAAQLINNMSDKYLLDKDIALSEGLEESFVSGAVMAGLGFSAPVLAADLASTFTRDDVLIENNKRIKEIFGITQAINKLSTQLKSDPSVAETIKVLQDRQDKLYKEHQDSLNNVYKSIDNMSNVDKRTLLDIDTYLYRVKKSIDKINSDPNLSTEQKANLIGTFMGRVDTLNAKKNKIINSYQYSKEQQRARRFQEKLIAENGLEGKVQIVEGDTQKEALDKAKEAINNSELDAEVKKQLIEKIDKQAADPNFYAHGFTVGAEFGLPITVQMKDNATNGAFGNSTVFSHELGHGVLFAKLIKQGADVVGMGQMLEDYARKNIKGANAIFDRVYRDYGKLLNKTSEEYDPQAFAEELFLALKDVYSKRKDALDLTFRGKLFKAWNKLKGQDKRADNEIKNGQDVLDLMTSFVSSFETGEITGSFKALMEGRLKTVKANAAQKAKDGKISMSQTKLSQQEMNDRVDNLVGKKDASGNYTWDSKESFQMSEEFANTYEQLIMGNLIDPLITRGIEGDSVRGVSMEDFIQQVKDQIADLLIKFDPTQNNSLIGYINSLLFKKKGTVLNKLKAQQPIRSKSIDTEAGEAGAVTGAEQISAQTAEDTVNTEEREAREAKEVKKPIKDRLKFGPAKEKIITKLKEKLAERVKYRISLFDATKSKNKFTTDFVRDLHKDLQEASYEIIMEGMNPQDIQAFERFLSDNYVEILEGLTTTYLSRAFPQAIQKKIVGEGYVNYPKWKGAKRGAKKGDVEFWKATEEGPYKGNTSGPQKIRRIKNIRNTIPKAQFTSKYIKGGEFVERSTEALARQLAAEMSLDILVEEIRNDGPIAQSLFERQELIRGMASTMAANDVIAQIERPGIKFSKVGNTGFNKLDDARRAHNKYLFSKPEATRERILDGEIDDPEYNKLYNALERAHLEYLSRVRNNELTDIQQEKFKKFERYEFNNLDRLIEAQVRYNDYSFTQLINEIAGAFQTAIKKITSDNIGYDNKSKAKRQKYKDDVNNIIMPYADGLIDAAETNNDKVEIINELIEFVGGSYAFKGFANNAEFKKEFIDPLAARHGLNPNSWTLEKVVGGQSIFYKGNKVATIYKQEAGAADIASVIKSKNQKITNTIDIKERNKNAKKISKRYMHLANHLKKEFSKGRISLFELGRISNALHSGYMRAAGKALAKLKGVVLYEGLFNSKDYTYEHTPPSNTLKRAFLLYVTGVRPLELQKVVDNSSVVVLPTAMANIVDEIYQSSMGKEYKPGDDFKTILENRYFDPTVQKLIEQSGFELSLQTIQDANSEYFVRAKKQTASIKQSKRKLVKNNNAMLPTAQQIKGKDITNQQVLDKMSEIDKKEAEIRFSKINPDMLNKQFNMMLEQTTGVKSETEFSEARAKMDGKLSGKKWWFIPPTAQDFMGLMYAFVGKGKVGDAQLKWIQRNLVSPYARAAQEITRARRAMYRDYDALKKELKIVPKDLKEKIPGSSFTVQHAVRAYIFTQEGHEIPGLTEKEARELKKYVADRPDLIEFAEKIRSLLKGTQMAKPRKNWTGGTITTDLLETLNTTKRAEALAEWQANVDAIFSKENLNKIEALYGSNFRYALENSLTRMKTGRNRNYGPDSQVGKWMDWLNSQTGTIMFFNMRSAVLQTISTLNFMNWSDNNPLEAAKAFANQKQYWADFFMLFNSDFLVDRRDGLKMEVNESDIADMAKEGASFQTIVNKVLKAGFVPTQIADSFAIAAGGATFYRNRLNRYIKEGMEPDKAAEQAFMDFRETAEEAQQSSRPDKISAQQAGNLGRFVLAFANTPAQYARLMNKAYLDLKNGRGDAKTNISKIIYYGAAQNLLFNALQQALFAFAFDEDEEEEKEKNEKYLSIANGMFDSVLRGIGVHGAIIATLKNTAIELYKESGKDPYKQEFGKKAVIGLSGIAPPLNSKIRKLYKAGDIYKYNNKEIKQMGWDIDNPALLAAANVISSVSNLPTDRMVQKSININDALTEDITTMQRIALFAGWSGWNLKIPKYDRKSQSGSSRGKGFNRKRKSRFNKSKFN